MMSLSMKNTQWLRFLLRFLLILDRLNVFKNNCFFFVVCLCNSQRHTSFTINGGGLVALRKFPSCWTYIRVNVLTLEMRIINPISISYIWFH